MRFDPYFIRTYIYGCNAASLYYFGAGRVCSKAAYCLDI